MTASALSVFRDAPIPPDLLQRLTAEVAAVEVELTAQMGSEVGLVAQVGKHTLEAGGKRLRPAFVSLAAQAIDREYSPDRARRLGACMEMIHMATLIHDDVVDDASTRRGRPTASRIVGNTAAILGGDVLLAKSMLLLAKDGDLRIIRAVSEAVVEMAEGEVRELETRGVFDLDRNEHLEVLRLKTASFIVCCCEIGGFLADGDDAQIDGLRAFGHHIGMAFQIVDDLLDYRGDRTKTGKARAVDFREGQCTLPLIYLIPELTDAESAVLRQRFGDQPSEDELQMLADWMNTRGAFARAEADARHHLSQAQAALSVLPENSARAVLEAVGEFVLRRER